MTEPAPNLGGPFATGPVGDFFAPFFTIQFLTYTQEDFRELQGEQKKLTKAQAISSFGAKTFTNSELAARIAGPNAGNQAIDVSADETGMVVFTNEARGRSVRTSESDLMSQLRNYVTSLEVSCPAETICTAIITIEPPYFAALEIIDNQKVSMFSIMVIEYGYLNAGNGEQIKSGKHFFMVQKPELEMSGTDVTIKLTGTDLFGATACRKVDRRDWPRIVYSTDLKILQQIAFETHMQVNVDLVPETLFQQKTGAPVTKAQAIASFGAKSFTKADLVARLAALSVNEVVHPLYANKLEVSLTGISETLHQDQKNWVFFIQLVRANNCSYYIAGNTIYLVDLNTAVVQAPLFTLRYFQQPRGPRDIPMLTFSANALTDLFIPPAAAGIRNASASPDEGVARFEHFDPSISAIAEHIGGRTASGTRLQNGKVLVIDDNITIRPLPVFSPTQVGEYLALPHGQQNRQEAGRTPARRGSLVGNTAASCTIPGTPHITPMMVVRLAGVGRVFGGCYLVKTTKHRLGTDGYETELELIRDSSTGDPVVGTGVTPATGANNKATDERPGQVVPPVGPEDA